MLVSLEYCISAKLCWHLWCWGGRHSLIIPIIAITCQTRWSHLIRSHHSHTTPASITQTLTQGSTHHWIVEILPCEILPCESTFHKFKCNLFLWFLTPQSHSLAKNMLNKKMKPVRSMRFLFHWQINSNWAVWLESWWLITFTTAGHVTSRYVTLCHAAAAAWCHHQHLITPCFTASSPPPHQSLQMLTLIEFNTFTLYEAQHQQSALSIRSVLMKYHRLELKY